MSMCAWCLTVGRRHPHPHCSPLSSMPAFPVIIAYSPLVSLSPTLGVRVQERFVRRLGHHLRGPLDEADRDPRLALARHLL